MYLGRISNVTWRLLQNSAWALSVQLLIRHALRWSKTIIVSKVEI